MNTPLSIPLTLLVAAGALLSVGCTPHDDDCGHCHHASVTTHVIETPVSHAGCGDPSEPVYYPEYGYDAPAIVAVAADSGDTYVDNSSVVVENTTIHNTTVNRVTTVDASVHAHTVVVNPAPAPVDEHPGRDRRHADPRAPREKHEVKPVVAGPVLTPAPTPASPEPPVKRIHEVTPPAVGAGKAHPEHGKVAVAKPVRDTPPQGRPLPPAHPVKPIHPVTPAAPATPPVVAKTDRGESHPAPVRANPAPANPAPAAPVRTPVSRDPVVRRESPAEGRPSVPVTPAHVPTVTPPVRREAEHRETARVVTAPSAPREPARREAAPSAQPGARREPERRASAVESSAAPVAPKPAPVAPRPAPERAPAPAAAKPAKEEKKDKKH